LLAGGCFQEFSLTEFEDIVDVVLEIRIGRDRDAPQKRLRGAVEIHAVQYRFHGLLGRVLVVELQFSDPRVDVVVEGLIRLWQIKRVGHRIGVSRSAHNDGNERNERDQDRSEHSGLSPQFS
jgi:hypothetical protein